MATRTWTDEQLRVVVADSQNLHQVCRQLGIEPGKRTYQLLRRHVLRLGIDGSHLPAVERTRPRRTWTDDDLSAAVANSHTVSDVLRKLGYRPSGGMHRYVRQRIAHVGIDTSHFVGRSWARGRHTGPRSIPLSEILVKNSSYTNSARLRERLIREGLKPARCEICGLDTWLGQPLPLALDHINGDHADNRIENLRIVCPKLPQLDPDVVWSS